MTSRPFERSVAPWLLILVSALVVFTLLPNNRSSILVKELAYCLGGAAVSLLVASAAARGVPLNRCVDWNFWKPNWLRRPSATAFPSSMDTSSSMITQLAE